MNSASALDNGTEAPARWSLRLLGGFELNVLPGGERVTLPGKRERVLLAYLALSPNCRQSRRKLAALLWGDAADETLLDNLRNCLWGLRKILGDTEHRVIASEGEDLVFDSAAFDVDALAFRRPAAHSDRAELEAAANLYSGEFLDGLDIGNEEFESWRRAEATRYRDQAVDILARLMTQLSACGENEQAVETGLQILRLEPLHEAAIRRLMRLYCASGRRGAAVQLYRTLADALKTELDAEPEAETRLAFAELARGGEDITQAPPAADAEQPPLSMSRARRSDSSGGILPLPTRPVFRRSAALAVLAAILILAIALISYRPFALPDTYQTAVAEGASSAPQAGGVISIAVLPFANLSGDAGQEFFSDGITEEITSALAKIPGLRVVARTSAFQFKVQNRDIQSIGQQLHATHFVEGSVRKEGGRVRVTAQLVKADDGIGLWTDNYDRELKDIFTTQEDIAQAIARALRVPLGLKQGDTLVRNRSIDPESYQEYLRAKALLLGRYRRDAATALNILELVVARNPDYAPAWALLPQAYGRARNTGPDAFDPKPEAAARRAIELDPNLADGYLALSGVEGGRRNWLVREELLSKALSLDPTNQDVLNVYSNVLAGVGRLKEALAMKQQLRALEPFVPLYNGNLADVLWVNEQNEAAIAILKDFPASQTAAGTPGGRAEIARIYAAAGRYGEGANLLMELSLMNVPAELAAAAKDAARLLRTAPAKAPSPQNLPRLSFLGFVYLHVGAPSRALEDYEVSGEAGFFSPTAIALLWHPSYAPVRKMDRFKTYVRKAGLVEYWRARGWSEFCRPSGADDFVCA